MSLMDFGSYIKLWAVAEILGLKSALNPADSSIGLLEIVPRHGHASLSKNLQLSGHWHAHIMRASKGQVVQNLSGTQVLARRKVGLVPKGPNVDVECLYGVFLLVPLL